MSKEEKEKKLKSMLSELLEYGNQESALRSLKINPDGESCTIIMDVTEVEEDGYIGFAGY